VFHSLCLYNSVINFLRGPQKKAILSTAGLFLTSPIGKQHVFIASKQSCFSRQLDGQQPGLFFGFSVYLKKCSRSWCWHWWQQGEHCSIWIDAEVRYCPFFLVPNGNGFPWKEWSFDAYSLEFTD